MTGQDASRSNCNPPEADIPSKYYNVWMPVPLNSGMVTIFAFLDLEHRNRIAWEKDNLEDFQETLTNRIKAVII